MTSDVRMLVPGVGIGQRGECGGCASEIWWAWHPETRAAHPWNVDGTSHFSTCPAADNLRPKKKAAKA